ncbi:MAG: MBL fold metallo-hydrolase [Porticoccus sp.]|jgi:glyoxylase-like metal-dependent hydrolase (beta-lactamase superfamily II)|nr:MBL fold metallo-hydrolase [Porticoccus sp.]|tara:strand:+ start:684 stop:1340 length:657 start_codon:yes stop_codon:yes gene_type:complete
MTENIAHPPKYIIETFPVGVLQCNCTIIGDSVTKLALVVDPGGDADHILDKLDELSLKCIGIIHTHAHFDHILAAGEIKKATGAPIYLNEDDFQLWKGLEQQCAMFGYPSEVKLPDPDYYIKDDHDLDCCGGIAIHTPGHTPGSTSFWFEESNLLIAGDTLFKGGVGRTDFPGGDFNKIQTSIRERIYTLNEDAVVITGHGQATTISDEKNNNKFVRP